ncbi:MAG: hypothetical protein AABZ12_03485 [Planctomycetota bacterium]
MSAVNHQQCPHCEAELPAECFVREAVYKGEATYLHCEFCGLLIETLWRFHADRLEEDFSCCWSAETDPVRYGMAVQRMNTARAA